MRLLCSVAALALAACASKAVEEKQPVSAAVTPATPAVVTAMQPVSTAAAKPVIGDFGLDLSAGNKSVKPGDDFFAYASGSWDETFADPGGQVQFRALRPSRRALQGAGAQDRRALGGGQGRHRHPGAADRRLLRGVHGRGRHRGPRPRPRRGRSWTASPPPRHARTSRACSARSASRRCSTSISTRTSRTRTATRYSSASPRSDCPTATTT